MTESRRVVTITNEASGWFPCWVPALIPTEVCKGWPDAVLFVPGMGGDPLWAVRMQVTDHGTEWGIGGVHRRGLTAGKLEPQNQEVPIPPFQLHPAVADDVGELIPAVRVNQKKLPLAKLPQKVGSSSAHMDWHLLYSDGAWHSDTYVRLWSGSPLVDVVADTTWSDMSSKAWAEGLTTLEFEFGEEFQNPLGVREGFESFANNRGLVRLSVFEDMAKGASIPLRGRLLCRDARSSGADMPDVEGTALAADTEWLLEIARTGFVRALGDFGGHYLTFGMLPETPQNIGVPGFNPYQPGKMFEKRPIAPPLDTRSAGAQPVFGVTHWGPLVTVMDPSRLLELEWNVHDYWLRGYHHKEATGERMLAQNHGNLHTYGGQPFFTGLDFLGPLNAERPVPFDGRAPVMDEMHDQWGTLICYYAATLCPIARGKLQDWVEIQLRNVRAVQKSMGMNRATGRVLLNLANAGLVLASTNGAYRLKAAQASKGILAGVAARWSGKDLVGAPMRPVQIQGPDPRGIRDTAGTLQPFLTPMYEALAGVGLWACWKLTCEAAAKDIALAALRTFVEHCVWQDATGKWRHPYQMYSPPGGQPLSETQKEVGSWTWKPEGFNYWRNTLGAVILLRDVIDAGEVPWPTAQQAQLRARCAEIIASVGANPPVDWDSAHHWATGARVKP